MDERHGGFAAVKISSYHPPIDCFQLHSLAPDPTGDVARAGWTQKPIIV